MRFMLIAQCTKESEAGIPPKPELMAAIHRGDAFLSRLEGEWWLRFLG